MYKKEGHDAFQKLQARITDDIVHSVFANFSSILSIVEPTSPQKLPNTNDSLGLLPRKISFANQQLTKDSSVSISSQSTDVQPKIGRNQACPCGSGKKYKRCHGSN
jgi:preprotein translocase subunit SecA